jgi:hypothetical protein
MMSSISAVIGPAYLGVELPERGRIDPDSLPLIAGQMPLVTCGLARARQERPQSAINWNAATFRPLNRLRRRQRARLKAAWRSSAAVQTRPDFSGN